MLRERLLPFGLFALISTSAQATNIAVSNTAINNNTGTSLNVQFDLSWSNSWRGGGVSNWDAAWVFLKWKTNGGVWQHVNLSVSGHVVPAAGQVDPGLVAPEIPFDATTNPVAGVFIRRSNTGTGTFALTGVQLNWNYASAGIAYNDIKAIQVFAVEMVYVNQGAFAAGGVGSEDLKHAITTISTASATSTSNGFGILGGQAGGYPTGSTPPLNASWPNGFNAFYCMKYEISQQQYVDFLNTLTYTQQAACTQSAPSSAAGTGALESINNYGSGIDIQVPGIANDQPAVYACNQNGNAVYGESTDGLGLALNMVNGADLMAYFDWSGLRPMSEMEYEKSCRGPMAAVPDEYPWGTSLTASNAYGITQANTLSEAPSTGYSTSAGNALYSITSPNYGRPTRVGAMAAAAGNTGRITSGAGYYGAMDLGGNVTEATVWMQNSAYTGNHGNGTLTIGGASDVTGWPSSSALFRHGGCYSFPASSMRTASRDGQVVYDTRRPQNGGRGVRTAP